MKTLDNKVIEFKGKPLLDNKGAEIWTYDLVMAILEGSIYQSSRDIIKATGVVTRTKVVDNVINFEDEDFKFLKQWASVYQPTVSKGLTFSEFYQELEK